MHTTVTMERTLHDNCETASRLFRTSSRVFGTPQRESVWGIFLLHLLVSPVRAPLEQHAFGP